MDEFVWTKKVPAAAGFYWKRNLPREELECVVEIRNSGGHLVIDGCYLSRYVSGEVYEWAGPIGYPTEPEDVYKKELFEILMNDDYSDSVTSERFKDIKTGFIAGYLGIRNNDAGLLDIMSNHYAALEAIEGPWDGEGVCETEEIVCTKTASSLVPLVTFKF
jgi:hypothetical protein